MSMGDGTAKALRIAGLSKAYAPARGRAVQAVRDFSLELAPGEFVTLLGPSGCGKTTVLRCLAGLEDLDAGEISIGGARIEGLAPHRRRIGLVFQSYALFPHLSVFENAAYSLRLRRAPEGEVRAAVEAALAAVDLSALGARMPGELSGGQQQRVAVARALVMKPDLLLFDEPLSNLDARLRIQVRAELRRLQRALGITALYVTHDQDEAMSLSDRIAVMRAGRIEQVAPPREVYARPATLFVAGFVGKANALPARAAPATGCATAIAILGHEVARPAMPGEPEGDCIALLRPEAIRLAGPSERGIAGRIEEIEYLGDRIEYRVRAGDMLVTVVEPALQRASTLAEGAEVALVPAADAIHLLPPEPG
ncbi:MAG: hypothetical protein RLZZ276_1984 [Pseudomonadota bacterium]